MRLIERRIGLLFAVFLGMLALAGLRAGWLGVVKADALRKAAATQQTAQVIVPARRGAITDRNGIELAVSQPATTVAVTPYLVKDPVKVAAKLAKPLRVPEDKLLRQLTPPRHRLRLPRPPRARDPRPPRRAHEDRGPRVHPRGAPHLPARLPRLAAARQRSAPRARACPASSTRSTALLRGRDGERRLVKDALGEAIELRETRKTKPGSNVTLTVDEAIQDKAEQVLAEVGETWRPRGATAIVMDPRDGALLALANWPRVNANNPGNAPDYARQNRAVGATYEPGSTFKAFTVAGALEEKEVTPETKFDLPPTIRLYDREIGESHPRGAVTLNTREILEQSSNVGAIKIGLGLGAKRFDKWVRRFGFGKPTGTDLPGEEAGIVLPLAKYSGASMGNLPIGQGLAVTPMQMAVGYAAIANGGVLRPAHIVEKVNGRPSPPHQGHRVISEANAASLRKMLEGVLGPGGTASGAAIKGYELAGKTGTAQKPDPVTGGYSPDKYVASFVGFAPARHPKLLVTVMVDEPKGEIYGGLIAAPAFKADHLLRTELPAHPARLGCPAVDTLRRNATHEVVNQASPLEGINFFDADLPLREALEREGGGWAVDRARDTGAVAGSAEAQEHGRRAERNEPRLKTHDRYGRRIDAIDLDPSWHWLLRGAVEREIHALPWRDPRPGAHVARAALFSLWSQANAGVMCPVSMTYSAIPALRRDPALAGGVGAAPDAPRLRARRAVRHGDDREAGRLGRARQHHARRARRRRRLRDHRPQVVLLGADVRRLPRARAAARGPDLLRRRARPGVRDPAAEGQARHALAAVLRGRVPRRRRAPAGGGGARRADDHRDGHPHAAGLRDRLGGRHAPRRRRGGQPRARALARSARRWPSSR